MDKPRPAGPSIHTLCRVLGMLHRSFHSMLAFISQAHVFVR